MSEQSFQTTGQFDIEESVDLEKCEEDPIHQCALIQPFGVFLRFDPKDFQITAASNNTEEIFDRSPPELINTDLGDSLTEPVFQDIKERIRKDHQRFQVSLSPGADGDQSQFLARLFPVDGQYGIEIEPVEDEQGNTWLSTQLGLIESINSSDSPEEVFDIATEIVREMTDHDRVFIYQFDDDGHGTVVEEKRKEGTRSYLGQRFPASDIPQPARRIYRKNTVRVIPRSQYDPVPVVGEHGQLDRDQLDLTYSSLRNVPLIHRRYLDNMGVGSSFSLAIIVEEELWGLITGHSEDENYLSWSVRNFGKILAQTVGNRLEYHRKQDRSRQKDAVETLRKNILPLKSQERLESIIAEYKQDVLDLMDANAFYAKTQSEEIWITDREVSIRPGENLLNYISELMTANDHYTCESIIDEFDGDVSQPELFSGFLSVRLSEQDGSFCVWFRPEIKKQVEWGGDPRKAVQVDEEGRLSPRNSFEKWTQEVSGKCEHWSELDQETATELKRMLRQLLLHLQARRLQALNENLESKNQELQQAQDDLKQSYEQQETLLREMHHRIKNNLENLSSMIWLQAEQADDHEIETILAEIRSRLQSISRLHDQLHKHQDLEHVQMSSYLEDIFETTIQEQTEGKLELRKNIQIDETISLGTSKAVACGLIVNELITNSLQHAFDDRNQGFTEFKLNIFDNKYSLIYKDDGCGLSDQEIKNKDQHFGLHLIKRLTSDQLNGNLTMESNDGFQCQISFPTDD